MKRINAWYGCRADRPDQRDLIFRAATVRLPAAVELLAHCPPMMDQGELADPPFLSASLLGSFDDTTGEFQPVISSVEQFQEARTVAYQHTVRVLHRARHHGRAAL